MMETWTKSEEEGEEEEEDGEDEDEEEEEEEEKGDEEALGGAGVKDLEEDEYENEEEEDDDPRSVLSEETTAYTKGHTSRQQHVNNDDSLSNGHADKSLEDNSEEPQHDKTKNSNNTHNSTISTNNVHRREARKERRLKEKRDKRQKNNKEWKCSYCSLSFLCRNEFLNHCSSQKHQQAITSDEGKHWNFRTPPRGFGSETYQMCQNMTVEGVCRHGDQCVDAHSKEELLEWKDRFDFRQKKAFKANKILGKTFVDTVIEKLNNSSNPNALLRSSIDGTTCQVDTDLNISISNKVKNVEWVFYIHSSKIVRHVALLSDENRIHFSIASVKHQGVSDTKEVLKTYNTDSSQEWIHPETNFFSSCREMEYKIKIGFSADFFGTFNQTVVFNFGGSSDILLLKRDLRVDVTPEEKETDEPSNEDDDESKFNDVLIRQPDRWDESNSTIIDFDPPINVLSIEAKTLYMKYPPPQPSKFKLSQNVKDTRLTKNNYRGRMHELLFIEEMAQYEQVSQFNVVAKLKLFSRYFLTPLSTTSSTAKYSRPGELFGKMALGSNLNEDTSAGRLILTNCSTLLLSQSGFSAESGNKRDAFVSVIEDSGKNTLYLRLSSEIVKRYELKEDDTFEVEIQFQLNRLPICEMHLAVDRLPDLELVYPNLDTEVVIPWSTGKQWSDEFDGSLNPKQREAVLAITSPIDVILPPILIIGPYGTGKTFTLGQSLKMLLKDRSNRILVCTHSNSAADLYIREYLHPYVTEMKAARDNVEETETSPIKVLRVYYENRWVKTVHDTVLKYCLVTTTEHSRNFRNPTFEEVVDCHIVVATLSTSKSLTGLGLTKGHFTHVLIDEAAQAMECEAIMALALASTQTRVVLAGDHMQLSPEVFSKLALEKKFNKSLLERLYDFYPKSNFPCKILLIENYRSHRAIIEYTSELFYEQKLLASGKQTRHDLWYPLTLFTARGEDVQDLNSTSFYNNAEVYEVVERVTQLQLTWPKSWGRRDETSIGIVTPYYDQVQRIRSELRKRNLFGVSVERVLNVQGKQFRAIFLSTVRTRKTCVMSQEDPEVDFGFLSNAKLLNTAITRAQSLVAVVGDPVALCSIGKCRKMWEKFMEICNKGGSFFGLTYQALRAMLDNVEFKKTYVLNPYAPIFVPRYAKQHQQLRVNNNNQRQNYQNLCRVNSIQGLFNPYVPPIPPPPPPPWMKYGPPPPNIPPPMMNHGWPPLNHSGINDKSSSRNNTRSNGTLPPRHSSQFQGKFNRYESPPPLIGRNAQQQNGRQHTNNNPLTSSSSSSSTSNSTIQNNDYLFLNDGVHFPGKQPPGANVSPFRNPPPTSSSNQSQSNDDILQFALQLLPEDIKLATFLKSNQMQVAWYNHLQVSRSTKEATFFKNFIIHLQSNPEIVLYLNKQLMNRKLMLNLNSDPQQPGSRGGGSIPFHPPPPAHPPHFSHHQPQVASAILAQDLEAQFLQQDSIRANNPSGNNHFLGSQVDSNNYLLPSAKSTDHFFSLSNRTEPSSTTGLINEPTILRNEEFDPQSLILSEILSSNNEKDLIFDSTKQLDPGPKVPLYMRRPGISNEVVPHLQPPTTSDISTSFESSFSNINLDRTWGGVDYALASKHNTQPSSLIPSFDSSSLFFNESSVDKPLTYANALLRNSTQENKSSEEERNSTDPLARIRSFGMSNVREDSYDLRVRENSFIGSNNGGRIGDFRLFDNKF
ncbi:probable helicase with zinc finger domain [Lepeophtheirus salmonis]|uniref:C3H1-type domain-containing protein n=1 Tax=Lepeophtheirus salmonis TaxID=72036 RepID=A0A0K2T1V9_LEPSM|nr:probable helicase with zinc finger domain [Lepeophtheirus salmonis]XP_040566760.1 probable helicase with zinc finger domain [Lepeophtheirus salmonis]